MAAGGDDHQPDCYPGATCIDCGGCECGTVPTTCNDNCWTVDDELQWQTEAGGDLYG